MVLRGPQDGPRCSQEGPKVQIHIDGPRRRQNGSKMVQDGSKIVPDASKISNSSQMGGRPKAIYQTRADNESNEHKLTIANILGKPECLEA